jgi:hypothetical protein
MYYRVEVITVEANSVEGKRQMGSIDNGWYCFIDCYTVHAEVYKVKDTIY